MGADEDGDEEEEQDEDEDEGAGRQPYGHCALEDDFDDQAAPDEDV